MAAPNIQSCSMVVVNVNGMQKMAMVRSATARLMRNALRSVRDLRPTVRTAMTIVFPVTASIVVVVYSAYSTYWCSSGRPGSCGSAAVDDSLNAENQGPARAVVSTSTAAGGVHVIAVTYDDLKATCCRQVLSDRSGSAACRLLNDKTIAVSICERICSYSSVIVSFTCVMSCLQFAFILLFV